MQEIQDSMYHLQLMDRRRRDLQSQSENLLNNTTMGTQENTMGLFKCIVSDLFFYNNQKSATSVFVILPLQF